MISTHLTNNTEKRIILTQIGYDHYTYDANGNPTLVVNDSTNQTREMSGTRKPLVKGLASARDKTSRYTYNASGERIVKSHDTMEGVYINGTSQKIKMYTTNQVGALLFFL